jgi:hypothetical protein
MNLIALIIVLKLSGCNMENIQNKVCEKYCNRRLANLAEKCPFCFEACNSVRKGQEEKTRFTVKCTESSPALVTTYEQAFYIADGKDEVVLIEERYNVEKHKPYMGGYGDIGIGKSVSPEWLVRNSNTTYTDNSANAKPSKEMYPTAFTAANAGCSVGSMTMDEINKRISQICKKK